MTNNSPKTKTVSKMTYHVENQCFYRGCQHGRVQQAQARKLRGARIADPADNVPLESIQKLPMITGPCEDCLDKEQPQAHGIRQATPTYIWNDIIANKPQKARKSALDP